MHQEVLAIEFMIDDENHIIRKREVRFVGWNIDQVEWLVGLYEKHQMELEKLKERG